MFLNSPVNHALIAAVIVQTSCQIFKIFYYSYKDKKFNLKYFFLAGGMPSSHSAFVVALTVSLALMSGLSSDTLAVSFIFTTIVIYDAFRLRGAMEKQNQILKKLIIHVSLKNNIELPQKIGHTMSEIVIGILSGAIFAVVFYFL